MIMSGYFQTGVWMGSVRIVKMSERLWILWVKNENEMKTTLLLLYWVIIINCNKFIPHLSHNILIAGSPSKPTIGYKAASNVSLDTTPIRYRVDPRDAQKRVVRLLGSTSGCINCDASVLELQVHSWLIDFWCLTFASTAKSIALVRFPSWISDSVLRVPAQFWEAVYSRAHSFDSDTPKIHWLGNQAGYFFQKRRNISLDKI